MTSVKRIFISFMTLLLSLSFINVVKADGIVDYSNSSTNFTATRIMVEEGSNPFIEYPYELNLREEKLEMLGANDTVRYRILEVEPNDGGPALDLSILNNEDSYSISSFNITSSEYLSGQSDNLTVELNTTANGSSALSHGAYSGSNSYVRSFHTLGSGSPDEGATVSIDVPLELRVSSSFTFETLYNDTREHFGGMTVYIMKDEVSGFPYQYKNRPIDEIPFESWADYSFTMPESGVKTILGVDRDELGLKNAWSLERNKFYRAVVMNDTNNLSQYSAISESYHYGGTQHTGIRIFSPRAKFITRINLNAKNWAGLSTIWDYDAGVNFIAMEDIYDKSEIIFNEGDLLFEEPVKLEDRNSIEVPGGKWKLDLHIEGEGTPELLDSPITDEFEFKSNKWLVDEYSQGFFYRFGDIRYGLRIMTEDEDGEFIEGIKYKVIEDGVELGIYESTQGGFVINANPGSKYEVYEIVKGEGYLPTEDEFIEVIQGDSEFTFVSKKVEPEIPDEPETPTQPDEPEIPTQPDEPEVPTQPDEPEIPTQPDEPEVPTKPEGQKPIIEPETPIENEDIEVIDMPKDQEVKEFEDIETGVFSSYLFYLSLMSLSLLMIKKTKREFS